MSTSEATGRVPIVSVPPRACPAVNCGMGKRPIASNARLGRTMMETSRRIHRRSLGPTGWLTLDAGLVATSAIGTGSVRGDASDGNASRALTFGSAALGPAALEPKSPVRPANHRRLPDSRPATAVVSGAEACDSRRARRDVCMVWGLIRLGKYAVR